MLRAEPEVSRRVVRHPRGRDGPHLPHHENEIAQSEAYLHCEQPFARYWLHWGPVRLRQEKMSKSTGLVVPIRELRQQYEPAVIATFC